MLGAPLLIFFMAAATGAYVAEALPLAAPIWPACGAAMMAVVAWTQLSCRYRVLAAALAVAVATAWRLTVNPLPLVSNPCSTETVWRVRLTGPVHRAVTAGPHPQVRLRVRVDFLAEACDGRWVPRTGAAMLRLQPGMAVTTGCVIQVPLNVGGPPQARNPGDTRPATWMRRTGLSARATVRGEHIVLHFGVTLLGYLDGVRQAAGQRFEAALPFELAGLAKAMVLGDTASLTAELRDTWGDASTAHLLAVSGLHVALVMGLAQRSVAWTWGRWPWAIERLHVGRLRDGVGLFAGAFFALLTGGSWAALRATLMAAAFTVGRFVGRPQSGLQTFGLAGTCLLWLCPTGLWDPGFLLSFAAVAGLLSLMPALAAPHVEPPPVSQWRWARDKLGQGLCLCAVAQLATAPICASYFGRVSALAAAVNVLAVPLGTWAAVPLALAYAALGSTWGSPLVVPLRLVLASLAALATGAAALPWATLWAPPTRGPIAWGWAGVLCGTLVWRRGASVAWRRWGKWGALVSTLALAGLWGHAAGGPPGRGTLQIDHLYVGQGDATLVTLPGGGTLLVDGGGSLQADGPDPGRQYVASVLRHRGIRRLDIVVLTHPHPDHVRGLLYITRRWPVGALWLNGDGLQTQEVQTLIRQVRRHGGRITTPPQRACLQGVSLTSHLPLAGVAGSLNDRSLALRLQYGQASIFLAGDMEGRAEAVMASKIPLTDILKVGHHGSRTSSSTALLQAMRPQLAVISCGEANPFGFPHAEALARLYSAGATVLRTDTAGAIHLSTHGHCWQVTTAFGVSPVDVPDVPFELCQPPRYTALNAPPPH